MKREGRGRAVPGQARARYADYVRRLIVDLTQFADAADAITWMDTPQQLLGGQRPASLLHTSAGFATVKAHIREVRRLAWCPVPENLSPAKHLPANSPR